MKMQTTRLLSPISKDGMTNLTKEVNETLVTGYKKNMHRFLSTGDLWNIQRNRKARSARRFM